MRPTFAEEIRDTIIREGWHKGWLRNPEPGRKERCLIGAAYHVQLRRELWRNWLSPPNHGLTDRAILRICHTHDGREAGLLLEKIIREQYPELAFSDLERRFHLGNLQARGTVPGPHGDAYIAWKQVEQFNDSGQTTRDDIDTVLSKAAAS